MHKLLRKTKSGRYSLESKRFMKPLILKYGVEICDRLGISRSLYQQVRNGVLWTNLKALPIPSRIHKDGLPHTVELSKARILKRRIMKLKDDHTYAEISVIVRLPLAQIGRIVRGESWAGV